MRAYKEQVPVLMSEQSFWKSYFQSRMFHRDRTTPTPSITTTASDIFDKYEQEETIVKLDGYEGNRIVDLTMSERVEGNRPDITMQPGKVSEAKPLIKRFNRHSELVLRNGLKEYKRDWSGAEMGKVYADV